jgi:hypothetical protein
MKKNGLLWACVMLLAGCAPLPPAVATDAEFKPTLDRSFVPERLVIGKCERPDCRIDLKVSGDAKSCVPKPDGDEELVMIRSRQSAPPRNKVRLVWLITTPGYSFQRGDGIVFKNGAGEFEEGRILNPREYQLRNRMSQKGVIYEYKIQLTEDKTGRKCVYDPGVVNDWP